MNIINYLERLLLNRIKLYICFLISWLTVNVVMIISSFFIDSEPLKWTMFVSSLLTLTVVVPSGIIYRRYLKTNT